MGVCLTEYGIRECAATLDLIEFNALKDAGASDLTGICLLVLLPIREDSVLICLGILCIGLLGIWFGTEKWSRM